MDYDEARAMGYSEEDIQIEQLYEAGWFVFDTDGPAKGLHGFSEAFNEPTPQQLIASSQEDPYPHAGPVAFDPDVVADQIMRHRARMSPPSYSSFYYVARDGWFSPSLADSTARVQAQASVSS